MENITVNGQTLKQYIRETESEEKSREIQEFLRFEIRSMGRIGRHHIISSQPARNVNRPVYKADGRVEVR